MLRVLLTSQGLASLELRPSQRSRCSERKTLRIQYMTSEGGVNKKHDFVPLYIIITIIYHLYIHVAVVCLTYIYRYNN